MLCILYVIAVTTALGAAAHLAEHVLDRHRGRRWLWAAVAGISVVLPPLYQGKHSMVLAADGAHGQVAGWFASMLGWHSWIYRLWLAVSVMLVVWTALAIVRNALRLRSAERVDVDGVPVALTESLGPATVGAVRPTVVLPRWALAMPAPQRRYVLRHEEEHRRSRDALLILVASASLVLAPWNIALWWVVKRLRLAVEIDCDARVVGALGDARGYGKLLLGVAAASGRDSCLQPGFLAGRWSLERRLTQLVAAESPRSRRIAFAVGALALAALVLLLPHPVLR